MGSTDYDVLGSAYEEVIQDIMTGKVLGQFFTQPLVKKMMVKLIDPQIKSDGKFESCCDPTMGTGGFLISYLQCVLKQAKEKEININWDYVVSDGLYGKELDRDTYRLAVSNMLISSGHIFNNLERGDSIREPITKKFDCVLANPPFGIDSLKYDELNGSLKTEYIPIKSNNAVSLFLQAIVHMLNINGRCAIVLPDGQDLFSKTNKALIKIRMYLMKTCDLKKVIYLPAGIFTYTSIKTCVFYFVKKCEGRDALTVGLKISRTGKETNAYEFVSTHQTVSVKFYDYDPFTDVKKLLVDVPIDTISNNKYSLNYAEYTLEKIIPTHPNGDITVKTLGEICQFLPKSKRRASHGQSVGTYPFYTSSQSCSKYCDTCDYDKLCLILGSGGYANIKCDRNFSCSADNFVIETDNETSTRYLYYYLLTNIKLLQDGFIGVGLKHISKEYISNILIPMPLIEKQCITVQYLDLLYEKTIDTNTKKINDLKLLNKMCLDNIRMYNNGQLIALKNVCKVKQGTYITPDMKITGDYPVYGGGNVSYYINQSNRENEIIVAKDGVSSDCVRYEKNKFFLNHHGWTIDCKNIVEKKYMYYFLHSIQSELLGIAKGTAQLGINQENFYNVNMCLPTLEIQNETIKFCEFNDGLIELLEQEIANNKIYAQRFIEQITKMQANERIVQAPVYDPEPEPVHELAPETAQIEKIIDESKIIIGKKRIAGLNAQTLSGFL